MEGADRKMMWAQRQRWASQLLKEAERKGASGLLQLRLFLAGEVGQHGWAVDAVCGEGVSRIKSRVAVGPWPLFNCSLVRNGLEIWP